MPSFQTDQLIIGGALISATGGVIYVGGATIFAGSGSSQAQLDALSGYANALFATTGSLSLVSGNLIQSGVQLIARDNNISGAIAIILAATGQQAWTAADTNARILSGNATQTGVQLQSLIGTSGATLYVLTTGLSGQANANYATVINLASTGTSLYNMLIGVSGQALTTATDKQIIFNSGGLLDGDTNLLWDAIGDSLIVGQATVLNSGNPIAVGGSGLSIQMGIQNISNKNDASSDIVATNNIGNDNSGYIDMGINSSTYNQVVYSIAGAKDGYLYVNGGSLAVGTATPSGVIRFHTAGTTSGNLRATICDSGIQMPSTGIISFDSGLSITSSYIASNSGQLNFTGLANNPIAAMYASGWGTTYYGPALYSRRVKYLGPLTGSILQLWGDGAVGAGTLTTPVNEQFGEVALYTPGVGMNGGVAFATATTFRGATSGIGNGFFFVSKFSLTGGSGVAAGGVPAGFNLEGGSYAYPSGSRIFVGLTSTTMSSMTVLNDPVVAYVGLRYLWASGGSAGTGQYMTNWAIGSCIGGPAAFTGNLAMEFKTGFYRFTMFCPPYPNNNIVYYQLDDILRGSGIKGQVTSNLPVGSTALRGMISKTADSGFAPIGVSLLYTETPNSTAIG